MLGRVQKQEKFKEVWENASEFAERAESEPYERESGFIQGCSGVRLGCESV